MFYSFVCLRAGHELPCPFLWRFPMPREPPSESPTTHGFVSQPIPILKFASISFLVQKGLGKKDFFPCSHVPPRAALGKDFVRKIVLSAICNAKFAIFQCFCRFSCRFRFSYEKTPPQKPSCAVEFFARTRCHRFLVWLQPAVAKACLRHGWQSQQLQMYGKSKKK